MSQYGLAREKISIKSLDPRVNVQVDAQYNPKELQIDRTVPWSPTGEANKGGIHLEFTGAQGRTMSVELLLDGYEGYKVDVGGTVESLERLASVIEPGSTKEDDRHPPQCMVTWGTTVKGFKCVIESLSTKYTMFDNAGKPLRATCTVKLKEADSVKAKGGGGGGQ